MPCHVAILLAPYLRLILDGRKTIESRLTQSARAPYRCIQPGQRIYFKQSSGPYRATAVAKTVEFHEDLTPAKIDALRRRLNSAICGDPAYWRWKRNSRYASFITLAQVEPTDTGPQLPPSQGLAWFVLEQEKPAVVISSPARAAFEIALTAGAIRNSYIRIPPETYRFPESHYGGSAASQPGRPIQLRLPGDRSIETDLTPAGMLRWRGWRTIFEEHQLLPGDIVRFEPLGPTEYLVRLVSRP